MTEEEWLAATNVASLLEHMDSDLAGNPERKFRLLACACCRRLAPLVGGYRDWRVIEEVEAKLEGDPLPAPPTGLPAITDRWESGVPHPRFIAHLALYNAAGDLAWLGPDWPYTYRPPNAADAADLAALARGPGASNADLFRDIFGNLFRPVVVAPSWRTPLATGLAHAIYNDRELPAGRFDNARLGVLADALEDAGCNNADVLGHLRGGGEHVRGCWAVDLVLGKS